MAVVLSLIALIALPRLIGIDRFATIDEPYWLTAGSDFYYALGQRAFANTFYDYHPAVTTMWIITAAMLVYFPQYRGFGQGYFDVYKDSLERFLLSHGHTPLGLLTTARVIQTVLIVGLLLLMFWLMRRLLGAKIAVTALLLISFDPFFLGHSRLLNHEAMLSLFVLVSLLALLTHLFLERKAGFLILSGAAAGLAQLTKSSSIVLMPAIGLLFVFEVFFHRRVGWKRRVPAALVEAGAWLAMVALVYFVFWPGMWVAPGEMLTQVYGNAFSYAFEGSRLSVTGGVPLAPPQLGLGDVAIYVQSMLWRTTPVIWIGTPLVVAALLRRDWEGRIVLLSVFLVGSLFVILFGVVSGRNSAHYVLTSYVSLDIIVATGIVEAADWLGGYLTGVRRRLVPALILGAALMAQAASALAFFPYYYIYYNPILEASQPGRGNPNFGYGEGLDLAASYLRVKPGAPESTVMAFYGRGPFSFFYPGRTEQLKPVYADAENVPQLKQILHSSDYLVIYYELEKERDSPANVMGALKGAVPEKIIWLNNIDYIHIYRVDLLPPQFYEALTP
jgi:4-amino-4-deoxy-L-arabinose transferase-like glycosyltransferase